MKRTLPLVVLSILILSFLGASVVVPTSAALTSRNGSFTTDRGTAITLNSTLEHDGVDGSQPVLKANKAYTLSINVTMTELGDADDFHDMEFTIEMTTEAWIGSGKPVYSAYYYDKTTRFTEVGDSKVYTFTIFLTGEIVEDDTDLDIEFKGKENVPNRPDPTTSFTNLGYIVTIQPADGSTTPITSGTEIENRLVQYPTPEGSDIRIEVNMAHDGLEKDKPTLLSNMYYNMTVNFTILDIGGDVESIKNMEVFVEMEDSAITDYIPGNSAVKYFSAYGTEENDFVEGESKLFNFYMLASTNLNDTQVELKFKFKFTENKALALDKNGEIDISVKCFLNKGIKNGGITEDTRIPFNFSWMLISLFIAIPLLRQRKLTVMKS